MSRTELLQKTYMFSRFNQEALQEVANSLNERHLKAGELLFNMGDAGDELIIVETGKIAIFAPTDEADETGGQAIRIFEPGEVLGEMALIDSKPRSLSARAEEAATILTLKEAKFDALALQYPEMTKSIMVGLSDKIRYTTDFLAEVRTWVQRVSEGDYEEATDFLSDMQGWMKDVAEGDYDKVAEEAGKYQDKTLAELAGEFAKMAAQVKQREDELKQEVAKLKVEIDQTKRKQDVAEITGTEYYKRIREQAKQLRSQQKED